MIGVPYLSSFAACSMILFTVRPSLLSTVDAFFHSLWTMHGKHPFRRSSILETEQHLKIQLILIKDKF